MTNKKNYKINEKYSKGLVLGVEVKLGVEWVRVGLFVFKRIVKYDIIVIIVEYKRV